MERKLQVFVSSTYTDMIAERQAAVEAILLAGHIPAGMELFASGDESQLETIRKWIDESDAFVLILGGRYGTVEKDSGKSYIELEYDYAAAKNKPRFAVIMKDSLLDSKVKASGRAVLEADNGHLLKGFRERIGQKISSFFESNAELKLAIMTSLQKIARENKTVGWVRADDIVEPQLILGQMTQLQAENDRLRAENQKLQAFVARAYDDPAPLLVHELSEEAIQLLAAACKSDGIIHCVNSMSGYSVEAGADSFISDDASPRVVAKWRAGLKQLSDRGLLDTSNNEVYEVNSDGFLAYDEILAARSDLGDDNPPEPLEE